MDDLISRQAAIDEIKEIYEWHDNVTKERIIEHFKQLPPANNSEIPNSSDTISRAKAIEALDKRFDSIPMEQTSEILMLRKDLRELPPAQLSTNLAEVGMDCISRQAAIKALSTITLYKGSIPYNTAVMRIEQLPSAQPERTCVNCGRTANNGGWYADGGTRCPIEEHYALPKDGYCHLWEKRNVTDDDYPERRADE